MPDNVQPKVQFKRGTLANLPRNIVDGTIYVTTDEHAMYVDNGSSRIRIGDFIPVNTINDLPAAGHAYETAVYYVKTGNILARWDRTNSRWVQINKAGVVGVSESQSSDSNGNVISDVSISTAADGTLQLIITKVSVATAQDLSDLAATVRSHTTSINTIQGDVNTNGSILKAVNDARVALLGNATTYTSLGALETALNALADNVSEMSSTVDGLDEDVNGTATTSGLKARMTAAEGAITTLNGSASTQGSVANQVASAIAALVNNAPTAFDTLKEIADWIADHGDQSANLISTVDQLDEDINGVNGVGGLKRRMTAAEGDIDNLESDVSNLDGRLDTLEGDENTAGSVAYQINNALAEYDSLLDEASTNASTALDHLTWKDFDEDEEEEQETTP